MADLVNLNNSASNSRHVPAILEQLVNSEVGGDSDLLDFLNSETQELKLNFDQNDLTSLYHTRYCTENEIIALSHKDSIQKLFLAHFNVRSLSKNFDQLHYFIEQLKFNHGVIGVCETWLKEDAPTSLFTIDGYTLISNNRIDRRGGGVGFYVSKHLKFKLIDECCITLDTIESIFIEIELLNKKNIIVGEVYRPPNSNSASFLDSLTSILSLHYFINKTCCVMNDFNLNLLNSHNNSVCQDFIDTMLSNSYIPLIYTETNSYIWRFIYPRLIDNIFVNACPEISAGIITSDISDHFPIYALASNFVINYDHSNSYKSGFRDMSMTNLCKLRERLGLVDWSVVYNQTNTNLSFEMFLHILLSNYNSIIPLQQPTRSNYKKVPRHPWITKSLLKSINRKNNLFHKYRKNPNTANKTRYVRYRNILTSSLRMAKQSYFSRQFELYKYDAKSTWKVINTVLN